MSVFRFRDFQYDSVERRLTRNGEWVELTPKAMDILEVFVERPGQLISRDEIIGKVWGGVLVEEGNLSVHISKLRKALGESREQRYVETVAGSGYRFTGTIEQISNGYAPAHSPDPIHTSNGNASHGKDSEALRLRLKGKYLCEKRTRTAVRQGILLYEKSLTYDAGNLEAYAELVLALRYLYLLDELSLDELITRIGPWLAKMHRLEPNSDIVQVALGETALYCRWDLPTAFHHFRAAIEKNPGSLLARCRLTYLFLYSSRFTDAIDQLSNISALDPFSISTYLQLARFHYFLENNEAAMTYLNDAVALDPDNFEVLLIRGAVLAELQLLDKAESDLRQSLAIYDHVETLAMLGYVQALKNNRTAAVESIERMVAKDVGHTLTFVYEARIRFALGDFEIGYELLEKAVGRRAPDLLAISIDPRWRGVRRQDRFSKVVKEVTGQLGLDPDPGTWEMQKQPSRSLEKAA